MNAEQQEDTKEIDLTSCTSVNSSDTDSINSDGQHLFLNPMLIMKLFPCYNKIYILFRRYSFRHGESARRHRRYRAGYDANGPDARRIYAASATVRGRRTCST